MKSAIIAAIVAAIVSSGGTYAASGWINGKQIRPGTVRLSRLTPKAVERLSGKIGPQGPQGVPGLIDVSKITLVQGMHESINAGGADSTNVLCPAGTKAVNGGFIVSGGDPNMVKVAGSPAQNLGSWNVSAVNTESTSIGATPYVICVG